MSLYNYLTNDISNENYCWDTDPEDERTAQLLAGDLGLDDGDVTLDLGLDERADFDATLLAIADARRVQREIEAAWEQHEREEG